MINSYLDLLAFRTLVWLLISIKIHLMIPLGISKSETGEKITKKAKITGISFQDGQYLAK